MSKKKHNKYKLNYQEVKNTNQVTVHEEITESKPQIVIPTFDEKDFVNWKKIEIEIVRDRDGNSICIGTREFINKEISVFPLLTIPNKTFQLIRMEAMKVLADLKKVGRLVLKYAINPITFEFKLLKYSEILENTLIEKATRYPMDKVIDKVASNELLYNIIIDGNNMCYEPVLEDVIIDINNTFMVFGKNLEECIIKASCNSKELGDYFRLQELIDLEKEDLEHKLKINNNAEVFFVIAEAIRKEVSVEKICEITKIDRYFVGSIYKIVKIEKELTLNYMNYKLIARAMNVGISLGIIALLSGKEEKEIEKIIEKNRI